jgi:hypothetical protein
VRTCPGGSIDRRVGPLDWGLGTIIGKTFSDSNPFACCAWFLTPAQSHRCHPMPPECQGIQKEQTNVGATRPAKTPEPPCRRQNQGLRRRHRGGHDVCACISSHLSALSQLSGQNPSGSPRPVLVLVDVLPVLAELVGIAGSDAGTRVERAQGPPSTPKAPGSQGMGSQVRDSGRGSLDGAQPPSQSEAPPGVGVAACDC